MALTILFTSDFDLIFVVRNKSKLVVVKLLKSDCYSFLSIIAQTYNQIEKVYVKK